MGSANHAEIEARIRRHLDAGDLGAAATAAFKGYGPQIMGYLVAVLRDHDEATEAFGVFSEDLWRGLPGFRGESSFRTWAYRLALHAASRQRRSPHKRRMRQFLSGEMSALTDQIRSQTLAHIKTSVKDRFAGIRAKLDLGDQTLLILRVDRKLSWREVAEVMAESGEEIDPATLRKRYERLKDRLRELAQEHGLIPGPQ